MSHLYSSVTHPLDADCTSLMYCKERELKFKDYLRKDEIIALNLEDSIENKGARTIFHQTHSIFYCVQKKTENKFPRFHTLNNTPWLALYAGVVHFFLRASISSSVTKASILRFWTSMLIMSPFWTKPIGPPSCKNYYTSVIPW